uniref:Predicted protein n=1 Tax=Hordeum vulgare subsp. vulgare TaxID=112509 RepID=F2EFW6_HORVV|nr:predicted protein [Hordeum vulgare subsp. vulgare]
MGGTISKDKIHAFKTKMTDEPIYRHRAYQVQKQEKITKRWTMHGGYCLTKKYCRTSHPPVTKSFEIWIFLSYITIPKPHQPEHFFRTWWDLSPASQEYFHHVADQPTKGDNFTSEMDSMY